MTRANVPTDRLPDAGAGFVWDEHGSSVVLRPVDERVRAVFTTRTGGVCPGPWSSLNLSFSVDDGTVGGFSAMVRRNRAIAGDAIGASGDWSTVRQVHGADVAEAQDGLAGLPADGVWTRDRSRTVAVLAADCCPVLLVGDDAIGAAHAGWRGAVAGVVAATAKAVRAHTAFLGPAIGPCCFEVGEDVAGAFVAAFGTRVLAGERRVDLWEAAAASARRAGVERTEIVRVCTSCHADLFFSHRRDGGRTGRQGLVARLA